MYWWDNDFFDFKLLPNTQFDVIINEYLWQVFGKRITVYGTYLQPIAIRPEIKWDAYEIFGVHEETAPISIDQFLTNLEEKYNPST